MKKQYTLQTADFDMLRAIVQEELVKALQTGTDQVSAEMEYTCDGQTWRGTVFLVEDARLSKPHVQDALQHRLSDESKRQYALCETDEQTRIDE